MLSFVLFALCEVMPGDVRVQVLKISFVSYDSAKKYNLIRVANDILRGAMTVLQGLNHPRGDVIASNTRHSARDDQFSGRLLRVTVFSHLYHQHSICALCFLPTPRTNPDSSSTSGSQSWHM